MAVQGVGMLSLVHNQTASVEANFKEKDVGKMVPGQRAKVEIDAYPGVDFKAHIQSIGAGTGSECDCPCTERQRQLGEGDGSAVPVRIAFDGNPGEPLMPACRPTSPSTSTDKASDLADAPANVAAHPLPAGERIIVTIGVMMAVLLQVLDTTIANVALPHMAADLSASQDQINWVLTSYIVASAIALPISGWLADKVGRKRLLLISVVGFTVASVLCASAISLTDMVIFRAFQGVEAARSSFRSPKRPCST